MIRNTLIPHLIPSAYTGRKPWSFLPNQGSIRKRGRKLCLWSVSSACAISLPQTSDKYVWRYRDDLFGGRTYDHIPCRILYWLQAASADQIYSDSKTLKSLDRDARDDTVYEIPRRFRNL